MFLSKGDGPMPRTKVFLVVFTFLTGVALAPLAWLRDDAPIVALLALVPFVLHLRHGAD